MSQAVRAKALHLWGSGVGGVTAAVLCTVAAPCFADEAKSSDTLEEIVVTATRRESSVQNAAVSLTAVSGADIEARGLSDFTELAQSVPGVSMRSSGPGQTEFEMRGVASTGGNSPTVGFYLADTPLTAPAASQNGKVVIDPSLYDLNRVEVLRGPQGTLYGSGSMGGTIKLVPNAPNPAGFDVSGEAVLSDSDRGGFNRGENAMVNIPFGRGTAALRIVGSESHDSGWIDRVVIANGDFPLPVNGGRTRGDVLAAPVSAIHHGVNDTDLTAARASLLWAPTDQLTITPLVFWQEIRQDGLSQIDSDPGTNAHYQPFDLAEPFSDRFTLYSVNIQYKFGSFNLDSTTSRWNREEQLHQDGSEEWQWALGLPSYYTSDGGIGVGPGFEDDKSDQTSEELRLTSSTDSPLQWLVGYFYGDFSSQWNAAFIVPGAAPLFGTANMYSQYQPTKIIQQAVFGELSYQFTSKFKVTVGLRRFRYNAEAFTAYSGAVSGTGSDAVATYAASETDQGINPKFDLSYQATTDFLLYATAAKGFRPGGATGPVPVTGSLGAGCEADLQAQRGTTEFVPSPTGYAPDHVWSYEIGEKLRAFDNRLTLNSAVYYENWSDVQQNIPLSCGYNYQANAGTAHIYGSEVELKAFLMRELVLSANVGYAHAVVVSASLLQGAIAPGSRVQQVPDVTSSVSLAYSHPLPNGLTFTTRIETNYVGSRTDSTYAINTLPSYDLTQLRAGVDGSHWSVVLFAKNLFNQRAYLDNVTQLTFNVPTFNRVAVSQPLTIGIDANYRFGP